MVTPMCLELNYDLQILSSRRSDVEHQLQKR